MSSLRRSSRIAAGGDISPGSSTTSSVGRIGSPALSTRSKSKVNVDISVLEQAVSRRRTLRGHSESDSISLASTAATGSTLKHNSRQSSPEKAKGSPRGSATGRYSLKSDTSTSDLPLSKLSQSRRSIARSPIKQLMDRRTLRSRIIETSIHAQTQETEQQLQEDKKKDSENESSDEELALNTTVVAKQINKSAETTPVKDQKDSNSGPQWDSPSGDMRLELEKMWQAPGAIKDSPLKITTPSSNQTDKQSEKKDDALKTKSPLEQKHQENTSSESYRPSPTKRNLFSALHSSDQVVAEKLAATKSPKVFDEQKIVNIDGSISDVSTELFIDECSNLEADDGFKKELRSPTLETKSFSSPKSFETTSVSVLEKVEKKVISSPKKLSPIKEVHEKEQLCEEIKILSPEKSNSGMQQINTQVSSSPRRSASASPSKVSNFSPSRVSKALVSPDKAVKVSFEENPDEQHQSNTLSVESPRSASLSPMKTDFRADASNMGYKKTTKKFEFLGVEIAESSDGDNASTTPKKKTSVSPKKVNTSLERIEDFETATRMSQSYGKESSDVCRLPKSPMKSPVKIDKISALNETDESETEEKNNVQPSTVLDKKSPDKSINLTKSVGVVEETESDISEIDVENLSPKKLQTTPVARILPLSKTEDGVEQTTRKSVVQDSSKSPFKLQLKYTENVLSGVVVQKLRCQHKTPEKSLSPLIGKLTTSSQPDETEIEEIAFQETRKSDERSPNLNNSSKIEESKSPAKSTTPQKISLPKCDKTSPKVVYLDEDSESEVESDSNTASKPINWRNKLEQKYKVKSNLAESSEDSDVEFEESGSDEKSKQEQTDEHSEEDDSLASESNEETKRANFKPLKTDWKCKMLKELTGKDILGESEGSSESEYESDDSSSNFVEEPSEDIVNWKKQLQQKLSTKSNLSHYFEQPDDDYEESESDEETRLAAFEHLKADWRSDTLKDFANKELIVESSSDSDAVIDEEPDSAESSDLEEVTPTNYQPLQAEWRSDNLKSLIQNNYPSSDSSSSDECETPAKKQKTHEIASGKLSRMDDMTETRVAGKNPIPRSSSNNMSTNVAQASSSDSSDALQVPKSQNCAQKRKSSNSSPLLKCTKLQQWTVVDDTDTSAHDIWGQEVFKDVIKKNKTKGTSEYRKKCQLELNSQLKALRNWQVTPISPEKHTQHEQSETKLMKQAPEQKSENKKKKKKAQTNLDTNQTLPDKIQVLQGNKKGKISDDIHSSDSEPVEVSFETSRKSAFEVMQEALQSARREEEAKKKKRRERHERMQLEKLSQQGKKQKTDKASMKLPQDTHKKNTKADNAKGSKIPSKLPSNVLEQLKDNNKETVVPVVSKETVVPVVSKDGETQNKRKRKKKKRSKKQLTIEKQPPVVNGNKRSNTITKFDVADLQKVNEAFFKSRADNWRKLALNDDKKRSGVDMKLLKGKLQYLKKKEDVPKW